MFLQKNGWSFNKLIAACAALITLPGLSGALAADCAPYYEEAYWDPCAADVPTVTVYADFLYWQVHPEGLEFARLGGIGADLETPVVNNGSIISPKAELQPGFRVGTLIDLDCCNWDFYAQFSWLKTCLAEEIKCNDAQKNLQPLIAANPFLPNPELPLSLARGDWNSTFNVFDFGMGRTFSINCCFDFRPHLGFKASWQSLESKVRYETPQIVENDVVTTPARRMDIRNKADVNGIGLRGGFDAAWRFSPCLRLTGGIAVAAIWADIDILRENIYTPDLNATEVKPVKILGFQASPCALIPVTELLLGLRYDTVVCRYDAFVFAGWENQIWFDMNRFLFVNEGGSGDGYQFGTHGNVTYQGLTLRGGIGF